MNELDPNQDVPQEVIDAVIVDFINYVGYTNCVDYAMYTYDLKKEDPK